MTRGLSPFVQLYSIYKMMVLMILLYNSSYCVTNHMQIGDKKR